MEDSIFDRLFELLQTPGPVNWKLAAEVIKSVAGSPEPIEPGVAEEYTELTLAAELLVADSPGLRVPSAAPLHPVDRTTWAKENTQSFRYLVEPLAMKLSGDMGGSPLAAMGPALLGMQAGSMVGFMSQRALGQFDAGLPALDHDDRYLIVPNVEAFAVEHNLEAHQVRMWAVLREVVHHAILDRDWYRAAFLKAIESYFAGLEFNPTDMTEMMGAMQDPSQLEGMLAGPDGVANLLGMKSDPERLEQLQAMVAITEGYGDYVVARAAADTLPQIDRLAESAARRRAEAHEGTEFLQQIAGLDLQRYRSRDGTEFCVEIARRWGDEALDSLWQSDANLPTVAELTDPVGWAARVLL
ncbi:MAG: zinc-dependent metalloprotease [bacterium]|nr:zinc-dependent metalloprotease [bacterium]